jgi:hypothetical protein
MERLSKYTSEQVNERGWPVLLLGEKETRYTLRCKKLASLPTYEYQKDQVHSDATR